MRNVRYADDEGSLSLFSGWYLTDISKWAGDEDFNFAPGFSGAVQGMLAAWYATVSGGENVKWTKAKIAKELAPGGPHPKATGSASTVATILQR